MKSGLGIKLIIGMGLLAIMGTLLIPAPENLLTDIQKTATAPLDQINTSELAIICTNQDPALDNRIEMKKKEIQGKIVEWELEVLIVAALSDHYKILTKPTPNLPGTLLTLYPQNSHQRTYLNAVKPGSSIKVKGKIQGILKGRIRINPALLV